MLSYAPIKKVKRMERSYIEQKLVDYMASGKFIQHVEYAKTLLPVTTDCITVEQIESPLRYDKTG